MQGPCFATHHQFFGPVAQWLEQGTHNPLVVGSSPTGPTTGLYFIRVKLFFMANSFFRQLLCPWGFIRVRQRIQQELVGAMRIQQTEQDLIRARS